MIAVIVLLVGVALFLYHGGVWALAIGCAIGVVVWTYLLTKD